MAMTKLNQMILLPKIIHHPFSSFPASSPPSDQPPLISTIVSLLTLHRSKSRWNHLRSLLSTSSSSSPLTPTHFSQITLHLKSNPHLALRFFHFTLHHNFLCSHNLRSFSTVIHILSRARLKSHAQSAIRVALRSKPPMKLFKTLVKTYRECDSAPFVFDLLVKSCLELKKIEDSVEIVKMLISRGVSPQINICNLLIEAVAQCRGANAGYEMFREVFGMKCNEAEAKRGVGVVVVRVRPNARSFNTLMVGFYRDGKLGMVEEIWGEMGRFGCVADRYSYSVLLAALCEAGRIREAEKSWEEMKVKGIEPDVVAYNTIIGGFCKIGEVERAEGFFREMGLSGLEGSCVTFEHLINGYCRIGDVDSAMLVYKDMRRKDFRPEVSTMEVLIGGLCEKERVNEGLKVMKSGMRDVAFSPSGKTYELLIQGLCEDGEMERALKLQAEMVGKAFEPNAKIYDAFIEGYMKLGNEEMAAALRKEMYETQKHQEED